MRLKKIILLLGFLNSLQHCAVGTANYWDDYQNAKEDNAIRSGGDEKGHGMVDLRTKPTEFEGRQRLGRQLVKTFQGGPSPKTHKIGLDKSHIAKGGFGFSNIDRQTGSISSSSFNELRGPCSSDGLSPLHDSSLPGGSVHEPNPIVETNVLASLPPFGIHSIHSRSLLNKKPSLHEGNPSRRRQSFSFYASNPLDETGQIFEANPSSESYSYQECNPSEEADAFLDSISPRTSHSFLDQAASSETHPFLESILASTSLPFQRSSLSDGLGCLHQSKSPSGSFTHSDSSSLKTLSPFQASCLLDVLRTARKSNPPSGSISLHNISPRSKTTRFHGSSLISRPHLHQDSSLSNGLLSLRGHHILDGSDIDLQSYPSTGTYSTLASKLSDDYNSLRSLRTSSPQKGYSCFGETSPLGKTISLIDSMPSSECLLRPTSTQSDVLDSLYDISPSSETRSYLEKSPSSKMSSYLESSPTSGTHLQLTSVPDVLRSLRELRTPTGLNSYLNLRPWRKPKSYLDSGPQSAYQTSSLSDGERSLCQSIPSSRSGSLVKSSPSNRIRSLRESKPHELHSYNGKNPGSIEFSSSGNSSSLLSSNPLNIISGTSEICKSNPSQRINRYVDAYRNAIAEVNMKNNVAGKLLTPCSIGDIFAPSALVNDLQILQDISGNEDLYNNLIADLHKKIELIEKSLSQLTVDNSLELPESINDQNGGLSEGSNNFITNIFSKIAKSKTPSTKLDVELPTKLTGLQRINNNGNEYSFAKDTNKVNDCYGIKEIHKKIADAEKLLTQFKADEDSTFSKSVTNRNTFQNPDSNENYYRNVLAEIDSKIAEAEKPLSQFRAEDALRSSKLLDNRNVLQSTNSYGNNFCNEMAMIHDKILEAEKPLAHFIAEKNMESAGLTSNQKPSQCTENNKEDFHKVIADINDLIAEAEKPLSQFRAEDSLKSSNLLDNQDLQHNIKSYGNDHRNEIPEIHNKLVEAEKPLAQCNAEAALEPEGLVTNQKLLQSTQGIKEDFRSVIGEINNLIAEAEKPLSQYGTEDPTRTTKLIDNGNFLHGTDSYENDYRNEMAEIHNKIVEAEKPLAQFNAEVALESKGIVANQKSEGNKEDFRRVIADLDNLIAEAEMPLSKNSADDSLKSSKLIDNQNLLHGSESYRNDYGNEGDEIYKKRIQAQGPLALISAEAPLKSDELESNIDDFRSVIAEINSQIAEAEKSLSKYSAEESLVPLKVVSNLKHVQGINDYSDEIAEIHKKIGETEKWLAQYKAEDTLKNSDLMSNRIDNTGDVYCNLIAELQKKVAGSQKALEQCCVGGTVGSSELGNDQKFLDRVDSSGNYYRNAVAEIASLIAEAEKPMPQYTVEDILEPSELENNIRDIENLRPKRTLKARGYQNADNRIKANICPAKTPQQPTSNSNGGKAACSNDQQDIAERVKAILSSMRKHTSEMMKNMCDLESDLMATDSANDFTKITNNIGNNRRISPKAMSARSTFHDSKLYAKNGGYGSELKTVVDYPVRSICEPLGEAQNDGDTMLTIPMPPPMMMTGPSPKPSDIRVPPPKPPPTEGIKNDVPSDKLYQLWQKQLNNCKKMFNIAVNNNNNQLVNSAPIIEPCNRVGNIDIHSSPSLLQSNTPKRHIQAHLSALLNNVHNRNANNIRNHAMEMPNLNGETN